MKKLLSVLCVTLILSLALIPALLIPVSAASSDILKGTPVVDGAKDDIYDQTFSFKCDPTFYNTGDMDGNADSTLWALYDDKYLYLYVEVIDDDLTDADPAYLADEDNPWQSEAVEIWIDESGQGDAKGKFSSDYKGSRLFWDINSTEIDPEKITCKVGTISGGYSVEMAVEFPASYALKEGNSVGIALQINDMHADGTVSAMGTQAPGDNPIKLGASVVVAAPEPETTEPATEAETVAVQETEAPVVINTPSPVTGDFTIIFSAISLLGAGGLLAFKKRR